jgi:hypothetical protein
MFEQYVKDYSGKEELAKKLGICRMRLHEWRTKGVPFSQMVEVAKVTGISVMSLLIETYTKRYGSEGLSHRS